MTVNEFIDFYRRHLDYAPNAQQTAVIGALARFCSDRVDGEAVFLLNGYAGTGKTSLIGGLVKALSALNVPVVLLAPTGRAAKVFSKMASRPAYTIHRRIYRMDSSGAASLAVNTTPGTIFIVDEASMIGSESGLLEDLMTYAFSADHCKMILMGDTAQLPPVGCTVSPALEVETLKGFGLRVSRAILTDTVRQGHRSGILKNATWLRRAMLLDPLPEPKLFIGQRDDVSAVDAADLPDELAASYSSVGKAETILITRSNKRATGFNLAIRQRIFDLEEELARGERLLVAKNNYYWSRSVKGLDFIANGDVAVVDRVVATENLGGFRFADVDLTLPDRDISLRAKIMLEPLISDYPAMTAERMSGLMELRLREIAPRASESAAMKALRDDPYVNALQVKYAYAVTCHKAQGGQWADVYVDMGYIPPEAMGMDFYRWLYTATTRATSRLFFIAPTVETAP